MDTRYCNIRSFLLVHCVGVVLSVSYYQREYSGYSFTTPGFNDAERRSLVDARTWCNGNGSKLLAITDPNIQNATVVFVNDAIRQNQMTGNNIITDGQRTNGLWTWINGTQSSLTLEIGGQTGGSAYSSAFLYVPPSLGSFSLYASTPTDKKYFICEGSAFCGNGYQLQGQCFQSFLGNSDEVSWFEARNRCLQRGGDLATFEFITTNDGLNALNGSWLRPSSHYWIGLRREWWTWQSINSEVTYSQWSDGRPIYDSNQQCLCLLPNNGVNDWKWSECQCSQAYQFVCISSAGSVSSTSSTKTLTLVTQSVFTTSTRSTTTTTQSEIEDENSSDKCSHLGVGLGVGLGIGIPLLLIIIALVIVVIQLKRKLRNNASIGSSGTKVEMTSTPA